MLTGPDCSHHQGDVDMQAVRRAGHSFVGIKVSEGTGYRDAQFDRNRGHAVAAGLIRLLYHFCRPGPRAGLDDAVAEARWFVRCIGTLQVGEVVVADVEDDRGKGDLSAWTLTFLAEVDRLTGRAGGSPDDDAILYTYAPYARAHLRLRPTELGARKLWLAAYSNSPSVPAPWKQWTFWQHTSSGSCPGISGRCDLNRFDGPYSALQAIAGMTPTDPVPRPAPTPTEDDMARHYEIVDIPTPVDGKQLVGLKGYRLDKTAAATIKANDDGTPVRATVQLCAFGDALVLSFVGIDGKPVPAGKVGVVLATVA